MRHSGGYVRRYDFTVHPRNGASLLHDALMRRAGDRRVPALRSSEVIATERRRGDPHDPPSEVQEVRIVAFTNIRATRVLEFNDSDPLNEMSAANRSSRRAPRIIFETHPCAVR